MKKCPNCGSEEFFVTAHVTQDWLVDKHGEFMQVENECVEVTHQPKDDDVWQCADCGYDAAGEKFEVEEEEVNEVKKYTLKDYEEFCKNALQAPPIEEFEDGTLDEDKWYKEHNIHITVGNHDIELWYGADNVNEIEYALKEMYEAENDGPPTTGNTVGSEYRDATWKDILRLNIMRRVYDGSNMKEAIRFTIQDFSINSYEKCMKEINNQTSYNDEFEVNFFRISSDGMGKLFDVKERIAAIKEMLCKEIQLSEMVAENGAHDDKTVITDYSIHPSGYLVGWHYGVDWDINSEVNQQYINDYIKEMIG